MSNVMHSEGDCIGNRYVVLGDVGQGGMQEVYLAQDTLLSRTVALKVPKSVSAEKRFYRSAVVSAKVNHHNVAKTLDYLEEGGRYYLIEEYIDGCDLSRVLSQYIPRLDPYTVAHTLHHLAKGIAASHHVGVVHRDLKPSNVMIGRGPAFASIKITDFGIAKMAAQEIDEAVAGDEAGFTASQTALGALPYMAPEMIEDLKSASKPVDVWALGAIAYELLTGRKPFGQGYKAVPAIMSAKLPALPTSITGNPQYKLSSDVYEIIHKCINKDIQARPGIDEVVQDCEALCYSVSDKFFGNVITKEHGSYGYIRCEDRSKGDVFYHINSLYAERQLNIGDRVWFSRFPGSPRDRAFPIVKAL